MINRSRKKGMTAIIYKPCKTAMQSGIQRSKDWVLEFLHKDAYTIDPIMGWNNSSDMRASEIKIFFKTKEEAINYALRNKITFALKEPNPPSQVRPQQYIDNFKYKPPAE